MTEAFRHRLSWIFEHWRLYTGTIPLILGLTVINAAITVTYPLLFKEIVDGVESNATASDLVRYTLLLVCVGVAHFGAYATMQYARAKLNLSFEFSVRVRAFQSLTRMGPTFFSRFRTGDLITRLMDDVTDKLSWYMCSGIFRVLEAGLIVLVCLMWMLSISPKLTLIAAGPLPLLIVIFVFTAGKLHRRYEVVQGSISRLNEVLETCFSGIRIVKSFTAADMQRKLLFSAIEENREAEVRAVRWQTVMDTLSGNIWQLGIVAVLFTGGEMVLSGEITLGDLIAFDYFVLLLVWPMFDIAQFLVRGKLSAVSIDRVAELEEFAPDVRDVNPERIVARRPGDAPAADFTPHHHSGEPLQVVRARRWPPSLD
jgi:ATP-binding cassette subfamily B protein